MTTMALTVAAIRRVLQDLPEEDFITEAIASTSDTDVTVNLVNRWDRGNVWEFDDGVDGAELILIRGVDQSTSTVTMKRGHLGSTAVTHSDDTVTLKNPRFYFDEIAQAVNTTVEADLFQEGLFELVEHQITSSVTSDFYNAPSTSCERFLDVYQQTATMTDPARKRLRFSALPTNADSTLFANGKYFVIRGNYGVDGTDIYYVTCAHKLALSTLTASQERIVQLLSVAYLLEWAEPRRLAGPTNQGDRTVRPNEGLRTAAYYRALAEELMSKEKQALSTNTPTPRRFKREG